jgi:hypothetical protein
MQLPHQDFTFTLLTPCFSGTALGKIDDHAEMRVPPIRGHARFWHRALFTAQDANRVWGSTNGEEGHGSRVALRFVGPVSTTHAQPSPTVLPHKENANQRGPRPALAPGERFTLRLQRLVGCSTDDWDHAQRAVKLWLLLGCLGLRANRAAGSVWPEAEWVPNTPDELKHRLRELGYTRAVQLAGGGKDLPADTLRETASDTVTSTGHNHPHFGGTSPRQPSPTRFKVARLRGRHVLLIMGPDIATAYRDLTTKRDNHRWQALGLWQQLLP